LFATNIINEKIHKRGTINKSSFLNQFLNELLGHFSNMILIEPKVANTGPKQVINCVLHSTGAGLTAMISSVRGQQW
jgi:hypothetical protein